jgi:hypothetical protein
MKKAIVVILLIILQAGQSFARLPPVNSLVALTRGKKYVERFQGCSGWHPSSFIIRARDNDGNGIGNYLSATCDMQEDAYLHIYFGVKKSAKADGENQSVLVLTGAKMASNPYTGYKFLAHDYQHDALWATTMNEPMGKVPFDIDFDFSDRYNTGDADLGSCTTGAIDKETAREYIKGFQYNDCNNSARGSTKEEAESFLMSVNDIRAYLCKCPEVVYLQFYLGHKPESSYENLTILVVGLDKLGHHIWNFNDQGEPYLFGKGVPCPKCTVEYDASIDYHRQGAKRYRK